jgi:serine phosphatase RsbU (regulator of sigma subunit)/anti-sigma regulatory factor (Ser/Thr protein kinase)
MNEPTQRLRNTLGFGLDAPTRGSWSWIVHVAELTAWGTAAVVFLVLHSTDLPRATYRSGLLLVGLLTGWVVMTFRVILPRARRVESLARLTLIVGLAFAGVSYALLRAHVPSIQLAFVPVIVVVGLLTNLAGGLVAALAATAEYLAIAAVAGALPGPVVIALNAAIFALAGSVAGLLTRELRSHYSGELHEHRIAIAVRQRLLAVLDAVGEAIVFRDRHGLVRIVNERAEELFHIDAGAYLGRPAVELLRTVARQTEDPEGFMESFQELRDDPERELRLAVEQILPARRELRLMSRPTLDESGELVGRIDVYSDVTESVARAGEIERLYEEARKTAESYQRGLLPTQVPSLPRVNLVAHYIPAAGRRAVCGDFYDFVALEGGKQGVVLGDVCGIGPVAANDAALTRYTLRSFASEVDELERLVARLNHHVGRHFDPERFVRLLVGVLDPERATLDYINAGHVPPVVFRARSGKVEWLSEGDMVLGVDPDSRHDAARVDLDPGDMVVFYTDGVTEASRAGRPFGQGKFADLVGDYGVGTPGELVQAIRRAVEAWVGDDELRDDIALLVCQIVPDATLQEPTRELVVPNDSSRLGDGRDFVAGFLVDVRASVEASQEMLLAVGEAIANACRHGRRAEGRSEIRVRCSLEGSDVVVTVSDDGGGFDVSAYDSTRLPDRFASGGRGLFLMRQFVDSCDIDSSPQGTTVKLRRRVVPEVTASPRSDGA